MIEIELVKQAYDVKELNHDATFILDGSYITAMYPL